MTNTLKSTGSNSVPAKSTAVRAVKSGQVLGVTKDGVKIVRPSRAPTSFTAEEAREMVANAVRKSA